MRTTTLARTGAALTASALAFTLTSGPASAATDDTAAYQPDTTTVSGLSSTGGSAWAPAAGTKSPAGVKTPAVAEISKLRIASGVIYRKGSNSVQILEIAGDPGTSPGGAAPQKTTFTLKVGKKNHTVQYKFDATESVAFFDTNSGWGTGKAQILNTTVTYTDGTTSTDGTDSNTFYLRRATKASNPAFKVTTYTPGTKIKFQPRGFKVFNPSKGKYVSLGKIRLQYKKSGSWKTVKNIKLNSSGNGSYTYKAPTRTYRLYIPTTSNVIGGESDYVTG